MPDVGAEYRRLSTDDGRDRMQSQNQSQAYPHRDSAASGRIHLHVPYLHLMRWRRVLLLVLVLALAGPPLALWLPSHTLASYLRSPWIEPMSRRIEDLRKANTHAPLYPSQRVVVSLTTFAHRMHNVEYTLRSLMAQSRKPDIIYLAIPYRVERLNEPPTIDKTNDSASAGKKQAGDKARAAKNAVKERTNGAGNTSGGSGSGSGYNGKRANPSTDVDEKIKQLQQLVGSNLLKVLRIQDYGPATKLLAALENEKDPETVVITVDDDAEYHPDTILMLLDAITVHRGFAPCFICEFWMPILNRSKWQKWEGLCAGWANAYTGVAYRVGYFGPEVFDHSSAPKGCKLHDDVWISGNMFRNGHRPFVLIPGFDTVLKHRSSGNMSIGSVPNSERDYRNPCIQHFDAFS